MQNDCFEYKTEEGDVAMATLTDDNIVIEQSGKWNVSVNLYSLH